MKQRFISILSLLTSSGTLLCCVLPALVASIAGGAAVVSMLSVFPWIIPLSVHKDWIFIVAGILLAINAFLLYRKAPVENCDIADGKGCEISDIFSKRLFKVAFALYALGAFFSYALVPLMIHLGVGL